MKKIERKKGGKIREGFALVKRKSCACDREHVFVITLRQNVIHILYSMTMIPVGNKIARNDYATRGLTTEYGDSTGTTSAIVDCLVDCCISNLKL